MPTKFSRARLGLMTGAALALTGCSSGMPSLTGGPSEIDRTFLIAAGNWDRNKDGNVTCDEWKAYATELFEIGDVERKGHVTPEDWKRIIAVDRMFETVDFKYYDRNGDGKIDSSDTQVGGVLTNSEGIRAVVTGISGAGLICLPNYHPISIQTSTGQSLTCVPDDVNVSSRPFDRVQRRIINPPIR